MLLLWLAIGLTLLVALAWVVTLLLALPLTALALRGLGALWSALV